MKHATGKRIATVALATALGVGTLTYALRAAPNVQKIVAKLWPPTGRPSPECAD